MSCNRFWSQDLMPRGKTIFQTVVLYWAIPYPITLKLNPKRTHIIHRRRTAKTSRWVVWWLIAWYMCKRVTLPLSAGRYDSLCSWWICYLFHMQSSEIVQSCNSQSSAGNRQKECCYILEDRALLSNQAQTLKFLVPTFFLSVFSCSRFSFRFEATSPSGRTRPWCLLSH
jgi:hypothetical protein